MRNRSSVVVRSMVCVAMMIIGVATAQSPARNTVETLASEADVGTGWNILSLPLSAFQFDYGGPQVSAARYSVNSGGVQFSARAPVLLPTGASIGRIGLFLYDNEPSDHIQVELQRLAGYGGLGGCTICPTPVPPTVEVIASGMSTGTPGYRYLQLSLVAPHTVDNCVLLGFRGIEIWWKRQISPAPSVALFVDVPTTHLFFREIEALADAGITLGCTAAQYCPNASVTRAQMAAFLARAVGLYWQY